MASRTRYLVGAASAAAIAMGPVGVWATPAAATTVECGAIVQGPVRLSHDLHCIGNGITMLGGELDLRGHIISGNGSGAAVTVGQDGSEEPVAASVVGGTITGFGVAVQAQWPNTAFVAHTRILDNARGIVLVADGHAHVSHTLIDGSQTGVLCSQGRITMSHSTISNNTDGAELFQCEGSTFSNVRFNHNAGFGIDDTWADTYLANPTLTLDHATFDGNKVGLHLAVAVSGVDVRASTFTGNETGVLGDTCVGCEFAPEDSFANNRFIGNSGDGLRWGFGTVGMYANTFLRNGGWGFFAADGTTVIDNGSNIARHNGAGDCHWLACN
jgi:hypothetical protein